MNMNATAQQVPHEYGPSTVGHGEAQCLWCKGTNRENAILDPNHCNIRAARDPKYAGLETHDGQWLADLPPELDEAGKNEMREKAASVPGRIHCFGHMSDEWIANRVRMLQRSELWHEAICTAGRDRIMKLSLEVAELRREVREWLCEKCNVVYPACIRCTSCEGITLPRWSVELRRAGAQLLKLEAERDLLKAAARVTWIRMRDLVPVSDGRMIWWDDDSGRPPTLHCAQDFSSEDPGYWAEVVVPARQADTVVDQLVTERMSSATSRPVAPIDRQFEAYLAHVVGEAAAWKTGAGAHPPALQKAIVELSDYYYYGTSRRPVTTTDHEFKNFHRLLCERFGCTHDEKDWRRDQLSLIEAIASQVQAKVCQYTQADPKEVNGSILFLTTCGREFWRESGKELYAFCPHCGGAVEEVTPGATVGNTQE